MTLTKCPNCGHTVLSVASQCPACAGSLTSTFLGLEHEGELAQCRSCGRPVRSRTAVCPHCGLAKPARRPVEVRVLLPIVGAALIALLAMTLRDRAFRPARSESPAAASSAFDTTPPPDTSTPPPLLVAHGVDAAPPSASPAESSRADTPAARPVETSDSTPPAPPPAAGADAAPLNVGAAGDSAILLAAGLQRRWTADWSNLRAAPHNEAYVVRVLRPGTEVRGVPKQFGWWAVVWKGDTVGYIAGALLRPTRPLRAP